MWLSEFITCNTNRYGKLKNVYYKDIDEFKSIVEALKTARCLYFKIKQITKKRDGITFEDLRIKEGVDAELVIENNFLIRIFNDYLKDDGLRAEVLRRVQDILDLISEHLRYRQEERKILDRKKQEFREECQEKIRQSYQEYLDKCKRYSWKQGLRLVVEEPGSDEAQTTSDT
jgi:hypothetical protein